MRNSVGDDALDGLADVAQDYSLLSRDEGGQTVSMHRLVQEAQRRRLGEREGAVNAALRLLGPRMAEAMPDVPYGGTAAELAAMLAVAAPLMPHAAELVRHDARAGGGSTAVLPAKLHQRMGSVHQARDQLGEAMACPWEPPSRAAGTA